MVSEIKRAPHMEMSGSASDIHVHLYIVVQFGMSSICEDGIAYLILRGSGFFFFRNKYSGQIMSKNKINILSRNKTKRNTVYRRLDNKWKIYIKTYFNRIFPVSSLSLFFLPCLVIFALNNVSVSFDISIENKWFLK
jgi:hypothetical protein